MEYTKKQLQGFEDHYQMWDWLAHHPHSTKSDYFREHPSLPDSLQNYCFLCHHTCYAQGYPRCATCPLRIASGLFCNNYINSDAFSMWQENYCVQNKRVFYAKLIRDVVLPWIE